MVTIASYYHSRSKRAFDVVVATTLLVGLSPFLFIIGALVLATAGWPILFVQKRLGKGKAPFHLYKFRTMANGAEKAEARLRAQNQAPFPMFKIFDDPRYVGVGKYLSRYGLDELPQLINILKGEMSVVGPRPLPVYQAKKLDGSWDFRYKVKPGIFSEWSLSPQRHTTLERWKRLEKETLTKSGLSYELSVIGHTILNQGLSIISSI